MTALLVTALAVAAPLLSAAALYGGSRHCPWGWLRLGRIGSWSGLALAALALALWTALLGGGVGLCVMLALWMLALMALPWLAALTSANDGDRSRA